jgi:hypothetical protein
MKNRMLFLFFLSFLILSYNSPIMARDAFDAMVIDSIGSETFVYNIRAQAIFGIGFREFQQIEGYRGKSFCQIPFNIISSAMFFKTRECDYPQITIELKDGDPITICPREHFRLIGETKFGKFRISDNDITGIAFK